MLLLARAATAAAEFDDHYEVQGRISATVLTSYLRASEAIASAQTAVRTATELPDRVSSALRRAADADILSVAHAAVVQADTTLSGLLDVAPGTMLGAATEAATAAHEELARVLAAWDRGEGLEGVFAAARPALARAQTAALEVGVAVGERARSGVADATAAAVAAARLRAAAAMAAAREHLDVASAALTPAVESASKVVEATSKAVEVTSKKVVESASKEVGDGLARVRSAALLLATAAEDVAVDNLSRADRRLRCSERVRAVASAVELEAVSGRVFAGLVRATEVPVVQDAVAVTRVLDAACCRGLGSSLVATAWWAATATASWLGHMSVRVADARRELDASEAARTAIAADAATPEVLAVAELQVAPVAVAAAAAAAASTSGLVAAGGPVTVDRVRSDAVRADSLAPRATTLVPSAPTAAASVAAAATTTEGVPVRRLHAGRSHPRKSGADSEPVVTLDSPLHPRA